MASITILCPRLTCRAILRVPESVRGKQVRCAECGRTFIVPATTGGASHEPAKPSPSEQVPAKR
jgi:hypothetical protein